MKNTLLYLFAIAVLATAVSCKSAQPSTSNARVGTDAGTDIDMSNGSMETDTFNMPGKTLDCLGADQCNSSCINSILNRHILTTAQIDAMRGTNPYTAFTKATIDAILNNANCNATEYLDIYESGGQILLQKRVYTQGSPPVDNGMLSSALISAIRATYGDYTHIDIAKTIAGYASAYVFRVRGNSLGTTAIRYTADFVDTMP